MAGKDLDEKFSSSFELIRLYNQPDDGNGGYRPQDVFKLFRAYKVI